MDTGKEEAGTCADVGHTHRAVELMSDPALHSLGLQAVFFPLPLDCTYDPFLEDITSRLSGSPCPSGTTRQQLLYGMQRAMAGLRLPAWQPACSHPLPRRSLLLFSSSDRAGYRSHGITNGFAVLERSWWWQRHCIQAATSVCCYGH